MSRGMSVIAGYAGAPSSSASCALLWPSRERRAYTRAARTHRSATYVTQAAAITISQDGKELGSNSITDLRSECAQRKVACWWHQTYPPLLPSRERLQRENFPEKKKSDKIKAVLMRFAIQPPRDTSISIYVTFDGKGDSSLLPDISIITMLVQRGGEGECFFTTILTMRSSRPREETHTRSAPIIPRACMGMPSYITAQREGASAAR